MLHSCPNLAINGEDQEVSSQNVSNCKGDGMCILHTVFVLLVWLVVATTLQHSCMHWRTLYDLVCEKKVDCHAQVISSSETIRDIEMFLHVELWMLQHN